MIPKKMFNIKKNITEQLFCLRIFTVPYDGNNLSIFS
jgi:hypothetical protein